MDAWGKPKINTLGAWPWSDWISQWTSERLNSNVPIADNRFHFTMKKQKPEENDTMKNIAPVSSPIKKNTTRSAKPRSPKLHNSSQSFVMLIEDFKNGPAKLAGMIGWGGYYTAEVWQEKTGINPREWPNYFKEWNSKLMSVTEAFRKDYNAYIGQIRHDYNALGIK